MKTNNTSGIPTDILIKFIYAYENGSATNNKRNQSSINVVIPRNTTQITVDGYIKKQGDKTYVHYKVSIPQNGNTNPHCKNCGSDKIWRILKFCTDTKFLELLNKVKHYLRQNTFKDNIKKGVKIFLFIKRMIEWWNHMLYIYDHLNSDWFNTPVLFVFDEVNQSHIIAIIRILLRISEYVITAFSQ